VARSIGVNLKPTTELQLAARKKTKMRSELLRQLIDFINAGFAVNAVELTKML
jgi:hypothetical protein